MISSVEKLKEDLKETLENVAFVRGEVFADCLKHSLNLAQISRLFQSVQAHSKYGDDIVISSVFEYLLRDSLAIMVRQNKLSATDVEELTNLTFGLVTKINATEKLTK
jgi:hypothetical protein